MTNKAVHKDSLGVVLTSVNVRILLLTVLYQPIKQYTIKFYHIAPYPFFPLLPLRRALTREYLLMSKSIICTSKENKTPKRRSLLSVQDGKSFIVDSDLMLWHGNKTPPKNDCRKDLSEVRARNNFTPYTKVIYIW
jgi:hypothetical protein